MNRVALLLATTFFLAASIFASDNVRAVQTKLKDGGFYFGQIDGAFSSDLSAAVTRYQIRNGLQITGKLDDATSRSLGVTAEVQGTTAAAPTRDTWRQLRGNDRQFLNERNARKPAPIARNTAPALGPKHPKAALVPAEAGDGSQLVLSRERLRDFIGAFVLAGLDPEVGAELEFFSERVRYYDDGVIDRAKIRRDLQRYDARWPERRFWLAGEVNVEPQPDSSLRVTFPLRFDLRNGAKHSAGKLQKILSLEVTGEDLQIVAVNERKAR